MANLTKGSTVSGYPLITEDNSNSHTHDLSDIDGLGTAIDSDTGPGSNFDADTLNGLEYSDIENNFVNITGDTIERDVRLTSSIPDNDLNAINREYVLDYILNETISESNTIPFVSISPSSTLTYNEASDTASLSSGDILIGGQYFSFTTINVNVPAANNDTKYIYTVLSGGSISLEVENNPIEHDFKKILVGTISFASNGSLDNVNQRVSMTNLGSYGISNTAIRNSAILSDNSNNIDTEWFDINLSGLVDTVCLRGDTNVSSGNTVQYTITDYDQLSNYSASVNRGSLSISGNTISFNAPSTGSLVTAILEVTRNSTTTEFRIEVTP